MRFPSGVVALIVPCGGQSNITQKGLCAIGAAAVSCERSTQARQGQFAYDDRCRRKGRDEPTDIESGSRLPAAD
jgi:hypothetical protein